MTKYHKRHRIIATFFLLIFFPTLLPNNLFASNNGPKSPEAASFEPVDATDMVNLITGQYSYVLPLLNVPSPEGGYPLSLSYHAGIALDQEASWTGLGWNVNPGAIERNVNGYPDDYNGSKIVESYFDSGSQESVNSISLNYSYGVTVGVGFNWGSNQALGGYVSVGYGVGVGAGASVGASVTAGTEGVGFGVNAQYAGGLSVGINADSNNGASISAGYTSNGAGLSVGVNQSGGISAGYKIANLGVSLSSNASGKRSTMQVSGIGINNSFNSTAKMGDYSTRHTENIIPIVVPTPIGVFSLSFGKQKYQYWLNKKEINAVSGPLNYHTRKFGVSWYAPNSLRCGGGMQTANCYYTVKGQEFFETEEESTVFYNNLRSTNPTYVVTQDSNSNSFTAYQSLFFDINELPTDQNSFSGNSNIVANNPTFPNYDGYNVSAQGLSGNMSSTIFENGALFGLSDRENDNGVKMKYFASDIASLPVPEQAKFETKPEFYFENEISTYIGNTNVASAILNTKASNSNIFEHYESGVDFNAKNRRKTSKFIEYFTNNEIKNFSSNLKERGYLQASNISVDRENMPKQGIGAFKITTLDGKTYHYSLPVYNHEILTRTFGLIKNRPEENQAYLEKRQFQPFATHWLLTAITGPDFVDNGDGIAGDGDLGYWTSFEYGKWTDAFIWKAPYKKDYIVDEENPETKTWIRGRKELYYLDKIKTRTHTALFIKSERTDAVSENWTYKSVNGSHPAGQQPDLTYYDRFTIPSQKQLKLDKIILLKNIDDHVDKKYGVDNNLNVTIDYSTGSQDGRGSDILNNYHQKIDNAKYNIYDNVLDSNDNWTEAISKSIKVIDFNYDNSLVPGDNRLTLKNVNFKGKNGVSTLPPYQFDYKNSTVSFNIDKKDGWGYPLNNPETYSLNKITTPQGGTINIEYESNNFISSVPNELTFSSENSLYYTADKNINSTSNPITSTIEVGSENYYPIAVGQTVNINYYKYVVAGNIRNYTYKGPGHISAVLGPNKYQVVFDGTIVDETQSCVGCTGGGGGGIWSGITVSLKLNNLPFLGGGPRVKNLRVSDGINNYITDYKYGQNEDGIGYVSYIPYSQNIAKELPYSSELPAPRVMYEYITMSSHKEGVESQGKTRYKFNIMKSKDPNKIKYGDFYEIIETVQPKFVNSTDKEVSISTFIVKDNLASIGQLQEVVTLNRQGQQLNKISNSYYGMIDNSDNIGVTQESYQTYKTVDYTTNSAAVKDKWIVNSSTRIKYPSILKSSTEQKNGYNYTTEFLDYDLISGIAKETKSFSSDGQSIKTKVVPAYLKYAEMGSKVDNINNKNMLAQIAANYSYIFDKNDPIKPWKETGVGITTWSNIWEYRDITGISTPAMGAKEKVWRKHRTYIWNGVKDNNGIFESYNSSNDGDDGFVWGVGLPQPANSKWKQVSEITLYDHYSAALQIKDINGNFTSTKMGDNESKVIATGNAGYGEMFYAGAENITGVEDINIPATNWLESGLQMINAKRSTAYFHTGKRSIEATNTSSFGVLLSGTLINGIPQHRTGKYKISVWVEKTNASKARIINNGAIENFTETYTAGNWVLKVGYINNVTAGNYSIYVTSFDTTKVYFDDLMIRPVYSSIAGYVYNEWGELTYIIGNNGLATKFEYDAGGRLIKTSTEILDDSANGIATGGFKVVKTNVYNNRYFN